MNFRQILNFFPGKFPIFNRRAHRRVQREENGKVRYVLSPCVLFFMGDPVIIQDSVGRLFSEFGPDFHSDRRRTVKQITLGKGGQTRNLHIDLPVGGGEFYACSRVNHLGEGVDGADHGIAEGSSAHFRMAIGTMGSRRDPESFFRTILVRAAGGLQFALSEALKKGG